MNPEDSEAIIQALLSIPDWAGDDGWYAWLQETFPHVCMSGFGERHIRLWNWFESIEPGQAKRPRVEAWPRGGAKSSTCELGCVRVGLKRSRSFVLFVCETQDQADLHVQAIGEYLGDAGIQRALGRYGHSKGWRRNQLRTATGFNVAAIGLDVASRGIKIEQYRPDLIIFDDIDNRTDTLKTVGKKVDTITSSIIPAGAAHCAVLFVQNLIHEDSIVNQLVDGRAEFLLDREIPCVEPAVIGLKYEIVTQENGPNKYRITEGKPTWEGQPLSVCESQINSWGPKTFEREANHELRGTSGYYFDVTKLGSIKPEFVPPLEDICLAWDLAATEGAGDYTAGWIMGVSQYAKYYVLGMIHGQWSADRVQSCISMSDDHYGNLYPYMRLRLPQDPGQAGKAQKDQMQSIHPDAQIAVVTGKKWHRARGLSEQINLGNVYLVEQDLPKFLLQPCNGKPLMNLLAWQSWHRAIREEFRRFRENVADQQDDICDAASDSYNDLQIPTYQETETEISYATI